LLEEFTFVFANMFAHLLFINNIEDWCMMSLPVFLIHEEGMTNHLCSGTGIWQGSDAADVAHSAKWRCVRVKEPA
jgi:hypothetical protein